MPNLDPLLMALFSTLQRGQRTRQGNRDLERDLLLKGFTRPADDPPGGALEQSGGPGRAIPEASGGSRIASFLQQLLAPQDLDVSQFKQPVETPPDFTIGRDRFSGATNEVLASGRPLNEPQPQRRLGQLEARVIEGRSVTGQEVLEGPGTGDFVIKGTGQTAAETKAAATEQEAAETEAALQKIKLDDARRAAANPNLPEVGRVAELIGDLQHQLNTMKDLPDETKEQFSKAIELTTLYFAELTGPENPQFQRLLEALVAQAAKQPGDDDPGLFIQAVTQLASTLATAHEGESLFSRTGPGEGQID